MIAPWRADGEWLRAALHVHSTNSDGELSARGVAQHYTRAGYDAGPVIHDVEAAAGEVVVRCTPARSVTLLTGKTSGTAVNAGRLGYRYGAEILEATADGEIVAARLDRPEKAPFARIEVVDADGRKAWTNPL